MKNKLLFFLYTLIFSLNCNQVFAAKSTLKVCSTEEYEYPYWFKDDSNRISGVRVDVFRIVEERLNSNIHFEFYMMPWSRCLDEVKKGQMDMILAVSYRKERAENFIYPAGAELEQEPCTANLKFYCSSYKILTLKTTNFIYQGNNLTLPRPIRVARGYAPIADLAEHQILAEASKDEKTAIKQLFRDQTGSAIVTEATVEQIYSKPEYNKSVIVQTKPFKINSYYAVFSKKLSLPRDKMDKIFSLLSEEAQTEKVKKLMKKY
jgi:hypothetical protein